MRCWSYWSTAAAPLVVEVSRAAAAPLVVRLVVVLVVLVVLGSASVKVGSAWRSFSHAIGLVRGVEVGFRSDCQPLYINTVMSLR